MVTRLRKKENAGDQVSKELQHGREYAHSKEAGAAPATILLPAVTHELPQPSLSALHGAQQPFASNMSERLK